MLPLYVALMPVTGIDRLSTRHLALCLHNADIPSQHGGVMIAGHIPGCFRVVTVDSASTRLVDANLSHGTRCQPRQRNVRTTARPPEKPCRLTAASFRPHYRGSCIPMMRYPQPVARSSTPNSYALACAGGRLLREDSAVPYILQKGARPERCPSICSIVHDIAQASLKPQ